MSFIDTLRKKLDDHSDQINALKARARQLAAQGRKFSREELDKADQHLDAATAKFKKMHGASSHALDDLHVGVKKALADLKVSTAKAVKHFNSHPAAPKSRARKPAAKAKAVKTKVVKAVKRVKRQVKTKATKTVKHARRAIAAEKRKH